MIICSPISFLHINDCLFYPYSASKFDLDQNLLLMYFLSLILNSGAVKVTWLDAIFSHFTNVRSESIDSHKCIQVVQSVCFSSGYYQIFNILKISMVFLN